MTSVSFASGPLVADESDVSRNTAGPVDTLLSVKITNGNYLSKDKFEPVLYYPIKPIVLHFWNNSNEGLYKTYILMSHCSTIVSSPGFYTLTGSLYLNKLTFHLLSSMVGYLMRYWLLFTLFITVRADWAYVLFQNHSPAILWWWTANSTPRNYIKFNL